MWCSCSCSVQGQELDSIGFCVSVRTQDILLITCRRFCHSLLTVFSDFQELLCIVLVLEQELCYLFLARFLQVPDLLLLTVAQLTALCWKVLPSCTLRQRAFPIFLSVLVLHHSNVSTLLTAAGTKLYFRLLSELKISDPDVWGVFIIWLCKSNLVYGLKHNITVKVLGRAVVLKVQRLSITKTFIMSDNFLQWFWLFWKCLSFLQHHSSEDEGLPDYQLVRCFLSMWWCSGGPLLGPLLVVLPSLDLFTFHEASICDCFRLETRGAIFI